MQEGKLLIVDGSSLVYRAFFALPLLQTKQGIYTNAAYGFTSMVIRLLEDEKPEYMVVAFDKAAPTFRHIEYTEYKAKRMKTPSELSEQMPLVREILQALHIETESIEGFEADDVIGTFARQASEQGIRPVIVTGDADLFQLVGLAEVIYTRRGISQVERYTQKELTERYGLSAQQFVDLKGLKGDVSDNIPGVPGIGEKTACKLLLKYDSIDGIYDNLENISGKLQTMLRDYREQAYLSKRLSTIITDVPVEFLPKKYRLCSPDYSRIKQIFEQLEFKSLINRLSSEDNSIGAQIKPQAEEIFSVVSDNGDWNRLSAAIDKAGQVAVYSGPEDHNMPYGLSVALPEETFYIADNSLSCLSQLDGLLSERLITYTYNAKSWHNFCYKVFGRNPEGDVQDIALAAYLLDPLQNAYPPERLVTDYLGRELPLPPGRKNCDENSINQYCVAAARQLFSLYPILRKKMIKLDLEKLYDRLELPLTKVLARMEREGIAVDTVELARLKIELSERMTSLEQDIYDIADEPFNLNSPKQLGYVLFEKLGLPVTKKTKTGFSTDAKVLEELSGRHEIVAKILQYRMLGKLLGTYLEGIAKLVDPDSGRVHTTFNQTVTATGGLSSAEPNLQNIPVRLEEGKRIRRLFISGAANRVLLSADYSQIELRILAHLSGDSVLIDSFCREEDIHLRTASEVFGVELGAVTKEMRDKAKAVNFGIVYGISDYGLSQQLGITRKEAKIYIERYLERYPGVRDYFKNVINEAKNKGYVVTIMNRRRYLPEINSSNFIQRSFAERTAMNTPIQGSAADIIKLAMLNILPLLDKYDNYLRLILQVHDELVIEIDEKMLDDVVYDIKQQMEKAANLSVPLTVDFKAGANWAEMKKLNL